MNLETFFTKDDIMEIYNDTVIYSVLKYRSLPIPWQQTFHKRYEHALNQLKLRSINEIEVELSTEEQLRKTLVTYQQLYNLLLSQNKVLIEKTAPTIENLIVQTIRLKQTEIERISFLFDFITNYVTYSEDYYNCCLKVPPIDGFTFDFKHDLPVDTSMNGMLVIGQGLCDDITNLMIYLGKKLDLDIGKIFVEYKDDHHSLNKITLKNGQTHLIDATRKIRNEMQKENCFLVSASILNKEGNYIFHEEETNMTYSHPIFHYDEEVGILIERINRVKPYIFQLSNSRTNRFFQR